jgi:hypothetical protein
MNGLRQKTRCGVLTWIPPDLFDSARTFVWLRHLFVRCRQVGPSHAMAMTIVLKTQWKFAHAEQIDQVLRNFAQAGLRNGRNYQRPVGTIANVQLVALGAAAMPLATAKREEVVIVERRQNSRIIVSIPGSYMLADHRNGRGERRTFPCRAVILSPETLALAAPISGRIGERAFVTVDQIGKFKGSVIRLLDGGFVMNIVASDGERVKLAAKIDWFEQYKNFDVSDQRADQRFVPENPRSRLVFADGTSEDCFVLDLSASGAALSAQAMPKVGTVLALATIVARVVRHLDGGFAVQFTERQNVQHVEARVNLESVSGFGLD